MKALLVITVLVAMGCKASAPYEFNSIKTESYVTEFVIGCVNASGKSIDKNLIGRCERSAVRIYGSVIYSYYIDGYVKACKSQHEKTKLECLRSTKQQSESRGQ